MQYTMTAPCDECPFTAPSDFTLERLEELASGEFPCHKACKVEGGKFQPRNDKTPHCAGALIFLEKQDRPHQMMRICERLGFYDLTKLDMTAAVVESEDDCRD